MAVRIKEPVRALELGTQGYLYYGHGNEITNKTKTGWDQSFDFRGSYMWAACGAFEEPTHADSRTSARIPISTSTVPKRPQPITISVAKPDIINGINIGS